MSEYSEDVRCMIPHCMLEHITNGIIFEGENKNVDEYITPEFSAFTEEEYNSRITRDYFVKLVNYIADYHSNFIKNGYSEDARNLFRKDFSNIKKHESVLRKTVLKDVFGEKWETITSKEFLSSDINRVFYKTLLEQINEIIDMYQKIIIYHYCIELVVEDKQFRPKACMIKITNEFKFCIDNWKNLQIMEEPNVLLSFYLDVYKNYFEKVFTYTIELDTNKHIPDYFLSTLYFNPMFNISFYRHLSEKEHHSLNENFVEIVISDAMENIKSIHSVFLSKDFHKNENQPLESNIFYYDAMRLADYYCFSNEFLDYFIFTMTYKLKNVENYTEDIKMFPSFGPELRFQESLKFLYSG